MIELPAAPSTLVTFIAASVVVAVTPGPGVLYIVTRSIGQGRRAGLASVAGVALGNFGNALAAAVGLGVLFGAYWVAFAVVKYVGALYLVYLGVGVLRGGSDVVAAMSASEREIRIMWDGLLVAIFNPKTALFFAAFLPQFMGGTDWPLPGGVALGTLFVVIATVTDTAYALAASSLAPALSRDGRARTAGRYATGGTLIGLGMVAAVGGPRSSR